VVQDDIWAILCLLTNRTQDMNQKHHISDVEPRNRRNSSLYIPASCLNLHSLFLPYYMHRQQPEQSQHHMTCTKQCLLFQHTPDNLHNSSHSLWAVFCYMQQYHNADASDVDSFSANNDGTKVQRKRQGQGQDADIGYESTPVI